MPNETNLLKFIRKENDKYSEKGKAKSSQRCISHDVEKYINTT